MITAPYTFPEVSNIIRYANVIRQMDAAWELMVTTSTTSTRYEYGFYIYYDRNLHCYYIGNMTQGLPTLGCEGTNARIYLGIVTNNLECCAFFHCHTTLRYCSYLNGRDTGPSQTDLDFARRCELPGILYDYSIAHIRGGHPVTEPHQIYTFGPERRQEIHN